MDQLKVAHKIVAPFSRVRKPYHQEEKTTPLNQKPVVPVKEIVHGVNKVISKTTKHHDADIPARLNSPPNTATQQQQQQEQQQQQKQLPNQEQQQKQPTPATQQAQSKQPSPIHQLSKQGTDEKPSWPSWMKKQPQPVAWKTPNHYEEPKNQPQAPKSQPTISAMETHPSDKIQSQTHQMTVPEVNKHSKGKLFATVKYTPSVKKSKLRAPKLLLSNPPENKDLLIGVVSSPNHFHAREAIRATWGSEESQNQHKYTVHFFVGNLPEDKSHLEGKLNEELGMVRLNGFTESYHNLTSKALGIYNWGQDNGFKRVLKVDDDTFVNVKKLDEFLSKIGNDNFMAGMILRDVTNNRNDKSKWYMYDQYAEDKLATYAVGAGVLLGSSPLKYLAENRDSLTKYRVDDAAVGIWLKDQHLDYLNMEVSVYPYKIPADSVLVNPVNHDEMRQLFKTPSGEGMVLQVCKDTCLCEGAPNHTKECFSEFANEEYQDIIPRASAH